MYSNTLQDRLLLRHSSPIIEHIRKDIIRVYIFLSFKKPRIVLFVKVVAFSKRDIDDIK